MKRFILIIATLAALLTSCSKGEKFFCTHWVYSETESGVSYSVELDIYDNSTLLLTECTNDRYGSETLHYRGNWVLMDDGKQIRCNVVDDELDSYSWVFQKVNKNTIRWANEGIDLMTY